MNQTQYFTLTQMIIDDVYFPWGATKLNQLGGGTYTVAGTRVIPYRHRRCRKDGVKRSVPHRGGH